MIDVLVIGAGIVGSWIALELSDKGMQVAVCEQTANGLDGISGRNSGVLHAGIYYPTDSLKAFHCVRGHCLTKEFASTYNIDVQTCGKLIVGAQDLSQAQNQEELEKLSLQARQNGVTGVEVVSNAKTYCKYLKTDLALYSKNTAIIDSVTYLKTVQYVAQQKGAIFLWKKQFHKYELGECELVVKNNSNSSNQITHSETIKPGIIINAAGLECANVAQLLGLVDYEINPNRGEYYRLKKKLPTDLLIYPLPSKKSTALGMHYTFHCDGDAYAGPNSVYANGFQDYNITTPSKSFHHSLASMIDFYKEDDFLPGYSGLRPRLFYQKKALTDYLVKKQSASIIHLLGIESPGLTSAPSLAQLVSEMI